MSENLSKVIERMSTDAAFRAELQRNPEAALASYQLTAEEKAALRSGDEKALHDLGVDARITKQALSGDDGSGAWPNTPYTS
jgi:putative modified peptide